MFLIKDTLVSLDIIERYFVCDINICKGQCCIDGDAGAPLLEVEKKEIDRNLQKIIPLLTPGGQKVVSDQGSSYYDVDGDLVTTLIEGCNCAFSAFSEDGICLCALEKAFYEGKLPYLKPSSCALYPIRLTKIGDLTALNFHKWKICHCAEKKGKKCGVRVYQFLRTPLIKKFGREWYEELEKVAAEWLKNK